MVCKTCENSLRSDFSYCPGCGAKVIRNRLTLKNIWQDLSFQVFNVDNTLLKTFRHMFSRPNVVIETYIDGTRKKYMNPLSYFAIAITLSGLLFYILRNIYQVNLTASSFGNQPTPDMDFIFDYQGLLSYLIMPLYALMTWVIFLDKRKLNYSEHLVANAYITAQISLIQFFVCLPVFGFFDLNYQTFNWFVLLFSVAFQFYTLKRVFEIGFFNTLLRGLGYLLMFMVVMMGIGIVIAIIGFLSGALNIEDFRPKK